jgi:hypothetical protein
VWFNEVVAGTANVHDPEFKSDGAAATGEVVLVAPAGAETKCGLSQKIMGTKFSSGMHLTVSVFAKVAAAPADTDFEIEVKRGGTSPATFTGNFDGSLLTTTYKRFVFNLVLDAVADFVTITFRNKKVSGTGQDITIFFPMSNVGDMPSHPTAAIDTASVGPAVGTTPAWSRTISQLTVRDASAPYV